MTNVLIIEDDENFISFLDTSLRDLGYEVVLATDGKSGIEKAVLHIPDAILLDLRLPGMDGKEVCLCLKNNPRTSHIPLIILTGEKDILDEAEGLKIGADDYLTKPFEFKVMQARLEKALQRARARGKRDDVKMPSDPDRVQVGKVVLNLLNHSVSVDGSETRLTPTEFKILTVLMHNEGRIIPRQQLISEVWHAKPGSMDRIADTHINNIRKKFGPCKDYLQTRYRTGYCFKQAD